MDSDEARERFGEALDGTLREEERAELDEALARDPVLRAELEAYEATVRRTRALRSEPPPPVDLVGGVQRKLRRRSGGRFYRDRFASRTPQQMSVSLVAAAVAFGLVIVAWIAYRLFLP